MNIYIKTYGCQMNERDSESAAAMLAEAGHNIVHEENEADVIILNTCSVRDQAEETPSCAFARRGWRNAPSL